MDGFPSGQRGQTVNLLQIASVVRIHLHPLDEDGFNSASKKQKGSNPFPSTRINFYPQLNNVAGWSSLEARRAHNPKVVGSNPVPATHAQLAQLVEQRTENPRVTGSIPVLGIFCR